MKTQWREHTASQLTFANRAKLRGVTFPNKVKRLVPANLERWGLQAANKIRTAVWKPANRYKQGKNNWKSKSGVNQMLWHGVEEHSFLVLFLLGPFLP